MTRGATPGKRGTLAVSVAAGLFLMAGIFLFQHRKHPSGGSDAADLVVVRSAPLAEERSDRSPSLPIVPAPTHASIGAEAPSRAYEPILRALGKPAGARLSNVTEYADTHVMCGDLVTALSNPPRRFVYLGLADLASIDDGTPEFEQMRHRLCRAP